VDEEERVAFSFWAAETPVFLQKVQQVGSREEVLV
jgi:hypothetical protein